MLTRDTMLTTLIVFLKNNLIKIIFQKDNDTLTHFLIHF